MSTHIVVIESVTGQASESAVVEISSSDSGTASFVVRKANGTQAGAFSVALNADHHASSAQNTPNLFSLLGYQNGSVIVSLPGESFAVLRHTVSTIGSTVVRMVGIPKSTEAKGSTIIFPSGSLGSEAHALVHNPNGTSIDVSLRFGTPSTSPVSTTTVLAGGMAVIPIGNDQANAILTASSEFTVQVLVKNGNNPFAETYVLA